MALIKCRECGKEISSTAEMCPQCGAKTRYGRNVADTKQISTASIVILIISIVGAILLFSGLFTMIGDISEYNNSWYGGYNYQSPLSDHEIGVITRLIIGFALDVGCICGLWTIKNSKSGYSSEDGISLSNNSFEKSTANSTMTCPVCSAVQRADRLVCMRCGTKFESESENSN